MARKFTRKHSSSAPNSDTKAPKIRPPRTTEGDRRAFDMRPQRTEPPLYGELRCDRRLGPDLDAPYAYVEKR